VHGRSCAQLAACRAWARPGRPAPETTPVSLAVGRAGTPPNLIRAIEMGAEDFLLKPFTQKELKEKVENVFRPKKSPGFGVVNVLCVDDQQVILRIVRFAGLFFCPAA
jgi:DNA-binding response OmpR family regulator